MITILEQPKDISFSKNPVLYKLNTNGRVILPGAPCRVILSNIGSLDHGENFTLAWGSQSVQFLVEDPLAEGPGGILLPYDPYSGVTVRPALAKPAQQLLDEFLDDIKANYYLDRDFDITGYLEAGVPKVQLLARKKDLGYQLSLSGTTLLSFLVVTPATPDTIAPNFKLYAEVWVKDLSGVFNKVYAAFMEPDNTGYAELEISESLNNALTFDRPNLKLPVFEENTGSIRDYYIKIAEASGNVQRMRRMITLPTKKVVKGGFSKELLEEKQFPESFIAGEVFKFLKQGPALTMLHPDQPDYLSWINLLAVQAQTRVMVTVTYDDATTQQITAHTFNNAALYAKYTIPCGFKQLGLHLLSLTKSVISYKIVLHNQAGVAISEEIAFAVDYEYYETPRYFTYKGSLGNYTSLFTHGLASEESDFTVDTAGKLQTGDFNLADGDRVDFSPSLSDRLQLSTGHVYTRRHLNLLRDFILSEDKHLIRRGRAIPFSFTNRNFKWAKDLETLYALRFEIGFRFDENLFTDEEDPEVAEYLNRPDLGQFLPPPIDPGASNFDDRYYLKTETYNKAQIDQLLLQLGNTNTTDYDNILQLISDLNAIVNQKAPLIHDHPEYATQDEINDLLINLDLLANTFYGTWLPVDLVDPDYINPYFAGIVVIHEKLLYQALVETPDSTPGVDLLEWDLIGGKESALVLPNQILSGGDTTNDAVNPFLVTVQAITWLYDNITHEKLTATELTLDANDPLLNRIDLIVAKDDGTIGVIKGEAAENYLPPVLPDGSLQITQIVVGPDGIEVQTPEVITAANLIPPFQTKRNYKLYEPIFIQGVGIYTANKSFKSGNAINMGDWVLRASLGGASTFAQLGGAPADNAALNLALGLKADKTYVDEQDDAIELLITNLKAGSSETIQSLRDLITGLSASDATQTAQLTAITNLLNSDNTLLDTIQEIVDYIEANRSSIDAVLVDKLNKSVYDAFIAQNAIDMAAKEPTITASGSAGDFWSGAKTFLNFATTLFASVLPAISAGVNTPIVAGISVKSAFENLQAQASSLLSKIGDLTALTTIDKSSIVAALNEVKASGGGPAVNLDTYLTQNGSKLYAVASGINTYTANLTPAITSYPTGQVIFIKVTNANTGPSTLALNGLSGIPITKNGAIALLANDLVAGQIVVLSYDGTNFQLLGSVNNLPTVTSGEKALTITSAGVQKNYEIQDQAISASSLTSANWTTGIASVTGLPGQIAWDTNYEYKCIGIDQWRRSALNGEIVDLYLTDINDSGGAKTTAQLETAYPGSKIGQCVWGTLYKYEKKTSSLWVKTAISNA